jgi:glycine/D-amino acid oxidase-like deaminating enzyme
LLKVIVMGAGIMGTAMSFRLAQAGCDVLLVDRAEPGSGASGNSFSWVNWRQKRPRPYFELSVRAVDAYQRLSDELDGHHWWHHEGSLQAIDADAAYAVMVAEIRAWGQQVDELTRAEAERLEPDLKFPKQRLDFFSYPNDGYVYARPLLGSLVAAGEALGLRTGFGITADLLARSGRVVGVRTAAGDEILADRVVVATGNWSAQLLASIGVTLPLVEDAVSRVETAAGQRGLVGLLAATAKVPTALRRVVHVPGLHFRPDGGGRILLQDASVEESLPADTPAWPLPAGTDELLRRARLVIRHLESTRIESAHIGLRPLPVDGFPVIGPVAGMDGLYLAVMHSAISLGPLVAELTVKEIVRDEPVAEFAEYRLERFAAQV